MVIGSNNFLLELFRMVMVMSVHALSWYDKVRTCALIFLHHIHYVNSDLRRHFFIDGYVIFPSLSCTISYPQTMSVCDPCIYFYFPFVSLLHPVLSPTVSNLDLIPPPSVSMLYSNFSLFYLSLTAFPTRSLVEGGPICRLSTCFNPMITSWNFANRAPCRDFFKNLQACVLCCSTQLKICLFQSFPWQKKRISICL